MVSPAFEVRFLAPGEIFGGAERQLVTLARGIQQAGIRVQAELFFDRELASQLRALDVPVRLASLREALWRSEANSPNVVATVITHAHGPRGVAAAALRRNSPLIWTSHGLDARDSFASPKQRAVGLLESACLLLASATLVYVTEDLAAQRPALLSRLAYRVIHNGEDLPSKDSLAKPPELTVERFNVVFAGRLEPVKAPLDAVLAMSEVPESSRLHLFILGSGSLAKATEEMTRNDRLRRRITVLGFRHDARNFIAHADAVVLPSRHEGLPYTAMEALGFGAPLIATEVGGLRETLRQRETALLVPPGCPSILGRAFLEVERLPELRRTLSVNGMRLQRTHFSAQGMIRKYLALYSDCVRARAGGTAQA